MNNFSVGMLTLRTCFFYSVTTSRIVFSFEHFIFRSEQGILRFFEGILDDMSSLLKDNKKLIPRRVYLMTRDKEVVIVLISFLLRSTSILWKEEEETDLGVEVGLPVCEPGVLRVPRPEHNQSGVL